VLEEGCQLYDEGSSVPEQSENSSTADGNKSDLIQFIGAVFMNSTTGLAT